MRRVTNVLVGAAALALAALSVEAIFRFPWLLLTPLFVFFTYFIGEALTETWRERRSRDS